MPSSLHHYLMGTGPFAQPEIIRHPLAGLESHTVHTVHRDGSTDTREVFARSTGEALGIAASQLEEVPRSLKVSKQ